MHCLHMNAGNSIMTRYIRMKKNKLFCHFSQNLMLWQKCDGSWRANSYVEHVIFFSRNRFFSNRMVIITNVEKHQIDVQYLCIFHTTKLVLWNVHQSLPDLGDVAATGRLSDVLFPPCTDWDCPNSKNHLAIKVKIVLNLQTNISRGAPTAMVYRVDGFICYTCFLG